MINKCYYTLACILLCLYHPVSGINNFSCLPYHLVLWSDVKRATLRGELWDNYLNTEHWIYGCFKQNVAKWKRHISQYNSTLRWSYLDVVSHLNPSSINKTFSHYQILLNVLGPWVCRSREVHQSHFLSTCIFPCDSKLFNSLLYFEIMSLK